ncbi:DNA N-6-adenine-methyltransferase (Dam) [Rubripirellula obstinata]|uniref:DNA N-6-adenine-methyltransferase (Dam) n=1 Tax=Rubripirellula obstinata TaxID=406547 RepID=A0A5B1CGC7_9BACT|nr:DNA N-6-adenine-methyltransferase [Rubripirellula obstinata]KAA1258640.1 DNA N-6-adenine-methyltransferase (Dam) [Rubripirellula obstinata]
MTAGRTVNSASLEWCTPPKYSTAIEKFFDGPVSLDPCSNQYSVISAKKRYQLPKHDGLLETWNFDSIFVNPPYGSDRERGTTIRDWLARCAEANLSNGTEVLALVPVAANTKHWKKFVWSVATGIAFLYDTRLKFLENGKDDGKGAPMACAMIYWGEDFDRFFDVFLPFGAVVDIRSLKGLEVGCGSTVQSTIHR